MEMTVIYCFWLGVAFTVGYLFKGFKLHENIQAVEDTCYKRHTQVVELVDKITEVIRRGTK